MTFGPIPAPWRLPWAASVFAASIALTLGFACAVPFAAIGALAALALPARAAIGLALLVWLANQILGFTVLHYPLTANALAWGAILGAVAVLCVPAARLAARASAIAAFAAAFIAYEFALFAVSATVMGRVENYTLPIIARILALNAAVFAIGSAVFAVGALLTPAARLPPAIQPIAPPV